jgi:hypothetical protein
MVLDDSPLAEKPSNNERKKSWTRQMNDIR